MKEIKQTYIENLETLEKAIIDGDKGTIVDITPMKNSDYFKGEHSYNEKKGICVDVATKGLNFTQWFSLPEKATGIQASNIYAFKKKYGCYPKKGIDVDVIIDENGFYRIKF